MLIKKFKKYIHILYIFVFNVLLLPTFSIFLKMANFPHPAHCGCLSNFKYCGNNDVLTVQKFRHGHNIKILFTKF